MKDMKGYDVRKSGSGEKRTTITSFRRLDREWERYYNWKTEG